MKEKEKIVKYCNKIEGREAFTMEEHDDFKDLCKKMSEEMPRDKKDDFDWVVAGLLGYIEGTMIGNFISKIEERVSKIEERVSKIGEE